MPSLVRVKNTATGHRYTVTAAAAARNKALAIVKEPAVDINGRPLPPTYAATVETDKAVVEEPIASPTPTPNKLAQEK